MSPDVLNNLPNAIALLVLTGILFLLRRRQPHLAINPWMAALVITLFIESLWFFTGPGTGPVHITIHILSLIGALGTGMAFFLFNGKERRPNRLRTRVILLNILPLLAVETLYGLDIYRPTPYYLCAAVAAAIGIVTLLRFKASRIYPLLQLLNAASIAFFAHAQNFRAVAYGSLGIVFLCATINSWRRLHKGSIGRVTLVLALSLWTLSLYLHPWAIQYTAYNPIALHVWEMQKFFAIIAILIILLESEIRENRRLAMHDQLTGLPNRGFLEERLLRAMSKGPCTVILLDLNDFKQFNDTLGHLAGDELLRQFSHDIRSLLGEHDTLARVGGDEFIIVAQNPALAPHIRSALPILVHIDAIQYEVFAGVGAASHPQDSNGTAGYAAIKQLILTADSRMYLHKAFLKKEKQENLFSTA